VTDLPLRTADLVGSLWRDVALRAEEERAAAVVPELGQTTRMVHDPDLDHLNRHRDVELPELLAHLVPLLTGLAERRDDLVGEIRLLRESIVAVARRLEERDDFLHRVLEARLEELAADPGGSS